ncbi:hypothetical protein [Flammeovirga sp. OC4]|uniref:hypothetical protein n=1 Tax=Flammeovirga sp. OC4 TaxID=1382345 RepID=UPI0012E097C5|nr:hypothetical protein [Flammeovirga sp. OC4]
MTYNFHSIKYPMSVFYFSMAVFCPSLFFPLIYGLNVYTLSMLLVLALLCILYYLNFSKIHWVDLKIELDKESISINGQKMSFKDLERYEFRRASVMSGEKNPLHLKFKNLSFLFHPPKKSPSVQESYDDFIQHFNEVIKELKLGAKQKILSKLLVNGMGIFCLAYLVLIIYMSVVYGKEVLSSMIPPFFMCISTWGAFAGIRAIQLQQKKNVS